jgi:hypothetical protein
MLSTLLMTITIITILYHCSPSFVQSVLYRYNQFNNVYTKHSNNVNTNVMTYQIPIYSTVHTHSS